MNVSEYVSSASAIVSLIGAAITLYLGRKSQSLQIELKRLDAELKQKDERRARAFSLIQTLQRYRLELYQLRAWFKAAPEGLALKGESRRRAEAVRSAYDGLLAAWSAIRIDVSGPAAGNLAAGFHDDRQVYTVIVLALARLEGGDLTATEGWAEIQSAIPAALEGLDRLELIAREATSGL